MNVSIQITFTKKKKATNGYIRWYVIVITCNERVIEISSEFQYYTKFFVFFYLKKRKKSGRITTKYIKPLLKKCFIDICY